MPTDLVPRRAAAAAAIVLVLVAAFASIPRPGPVDGQDAGADQIAALETRVADLDRRVRDLEHAASTPAPVPTEVAEASGAVGTLGDPVPQRQDADVGPGWTMRVVAVIVDGADELVTATIFTDPPVEGYQFIVVTVALTNLTSEPRRASSVVGVSTVGQSGVAYSPFDDRCGVVPDEFAGLEAPPGETVEGNLCFSVKTEDVASLILYANPYLTYDREDRVYFAVT